MGGGVQAVHGVHPDARRGAVEKVALLHVQHQDAVALLGGGLPLRDGEEDLRVHERGVAHLLLLQGQGHVGPRSAILPKGYLHLAGPAQDGQTGVIRPAAGGPRHPPPAQHQHGLHHDRLGQGALPQVVEQAVRLAAAEIKLLRRQKRRAAGDILQVGAIPGEMPHDIVVHRLGGFGQLAVLPAEQQLLALRKRAGYGQQPQQDNGRRQKGDDGEMPRAGRLFSHRVPLRLSCGGGGPSVFGGACAGGMGYAIIYHMKSQL